MSNNLKAFDAFMRAPDSGNRIYTPAPILAFVAAGVVLTYTIGCVHAADMLYQRALLSHVSVCRELSCIDLRCKFERAAFLVYGDVPTAPLPTIEQYVGI
jgi:hypothetical protein